MRGAFGVDSKGAVVKREFGFDRPVLGRENGVRRRVPGFVKHEFGQPGRVLYFYITLAELFIVYCFSLMRCSSPLR